MNTIELIDKLCEDNSLSFEEYKYLIENRDSKSQAHAACLARATADKYYGNRIYIRGLIEFTNYCRNNCYYCGIRAANIGVERYRLTVDEIIRCADEGYGLGFRTIVLQGGEDVYFTDERICDMVAGIKESHSDVAVTLSIGEKTKESYRMYREAGADRYLLRHETASPSHYAVLHPESMSAENRYRCLRDLKALGYQVGAGFMVGSPYQTADDIARDMLFLRELEPEMVGIGPFIPAAGTPFAGMRAGELNQTLYLLSLIRLTLPEVLLPATTALGTIDSQGREKGILAGANVVMPNLSPRSVRDKYRLYDNKICTGEEAAECLGCLSKRILSVGCELVVDRGDNVKFKVK